MIEIRQMADADARAVACIHAEAITDGFLARLGIRFLGVLYRAIAHDVGARVWVADCDSKILGFCAYAGDVKVMYHRVLRSHWLRLGYAALPQVLNPWVIKEAWATYRYPSKQSALRLPSAEILSVAIRGADRGSGTGRRLIDQAIRQAAADGKDEIKVLAGHSLRGANAFYEACGFERRAEMTQHGHRLNVYVKPTGSAHPECSPITIRSNNPASPPDPD